MAKPSKNRPMWRMRFSAGREEDATPTPQDTSHASATGIPIDDNVQLLHGRQVYAAKTTASPAVAHAESMAAIEQLMQTPLVASYLLSPVKPQHGEDWLSSARSNSTPKIFPGTRLPLPVDCSSRPRTTGLQSTTRNPKNNELRLRGQTRTKKACFAPTAARELDPCSSANTTRCRI